MPQTLMRYRKLYGYVISSLLENLQPTINVLLCLVATLFAFS